MFKSVNFLLAVVRNSSEIKLSFIIFVFLCIVANSALDIQYGWRIGNNKSVNFDTKVLLSQFDLIRYPQYDEVLEMNGRTYQEY
jgi:hypothetical protein